MPIDRHWGQEQKVVRVKTKADYTRYLRSKHWQELRAEILEESEWKCEWCDEHTEKPQVHHKHYHTLGWERFGDLLILCPRCHLKAHDRLDY